MSAQDRRDLPQPNAEQTRARRFSRRVFLRALGAGALAAASLSMGFVYPTDVYTTNKGLRLRLTTACSGGDDFNDNRPRVNVLFRDDTSQSRPVVGSVRLGRIDGDSSALKASSPEVFNVYNGPAEGRVASFYFEMVGAVRHPDGEPQPLIPGQELTYSVYQARRGFDHQIRLEDHRIDTTPIAQERIVVPDCAPS